MRDVADRAGVSQTTVSLVLNSPESSGIPETTQQRIREAVDEVGYRTNRLARAMRLSTTETIGFIADDIATTPFANQMIRGAQDAAWAAGHLLLMVNTGPLDHPEHARLERDAISQLLERQVDGIVFASMFHRAIDPPPGLTETRSVLLDATEAKGSLDSVVPDEFGAAFNAVNHLLRHGHRRIAHLTNEYPSAAPPKRLDGYHHALKLAGIEPDPDLVIVGIALPEGGRIGLRQLLELEDPPTAIFCYNDRLAMGVYQAAASLGLAIPGDLSIVGFDDQELIASELLPALTTMRLPHYEMGAWAVERILAGGAYEPTQHLLPCELVDRDSVAAPPR